MIESFFFSLLSVHSVAYSYHMWQCTELQASNENNPDEALAIGSDLAGQASSSISKENRNVHLENTSSNSSRGSWIFTPTCINHLVVDLNEISGSTSEKLTSGVSIDSVAKKPSRFEAAKGEAELDMLLDSFGETKSYDSTQVTEESSVFLPMRSFNGSVSQWMHYMRGKRLM